MAARSSGDVTSRKGHRCQSGRGIWCGASAQHCVEHLAGGGGNGPSRRLGTWAGMMGGANGDGMGRPIWGKGNGLALRREKRERVHLSSLKSSHSPATASPPLSASAGWASRAPWRDGRRRESRPAGAAWCKGRRSNWSRRRTTASLSGPSSRRTRARPERKGEMLRVAAVPAGGLDTRRGDGGSRSGRSGSGTGGLGADTSRASRSSTPSMSRTSRWSSVWRASRRTARSLSRGQHDDRLSSANLPNT